MLIEFSVSNFGSIREKVTFSMVAAPRLHKTENTFLPDVTGEKLPKLLKVAAIYGPNASGKTNLIKAFQALSDIVRQEPGKYKKLPVSPFRFDPRLTHAPTDFEVHFVCNKTRYEFALSATQDRILYEKLTAYPKGQETELYERRYVENQEEYRIHFEDNDKTLQFWKNITQPKSAFIRQVAVNSSEGTNPVSAPYDWLCRGCEFIITNEHLKSYADGPYELIPEFPEHKEYLIQFIDQIDVPISNIQIDIESNSITNSATSKTTKMTLTHHTELGEADFDYAEESRGTQALIDFWTPLLLLKEKILSTLVIDELDSSLHPMIIAELVSRHISNKKPAQLIFTIHNTHLMDTKLLRRDQIWITERDRNGATQLRSIHDFKGRESEDIEKRYFEGRYRGLPFIRKI